MAGVRGATPGKKMEIEIGFGAFWRIFVSKRQLSSASLILVKNLLRSRHCELLSYKHENNEDTISGVDLS